MPARAPLLRVPVLCETEGRIPPRPLLCKDCKHFIASREKCALFRVDDDALLLLRRDAHECRSSESMCGPFAAYFEPKTTRASASDDDQVLIAFTACVIFVFYIVSSFEQ